MTIDRGKCSECGADCDVYRYPVGRQERIPDEEIEVYGLGDWIVSCTKCENLEVKDLIHARNERRDGEPD